MIPLVFKKQTGRFDGNCPECKMDSCLIIENIKTKTEYSNTNEPKRCEYCDKNWVRKHTCKGSIEHEFIKSLEVLSN